MPLVIEVKYCTVALRPVNSIFFIHRCLAVALSVRLCCTGKLWSVLVNNFMIINVIKYIIVFKEISD